MPTPNLQPASVTTAIRLPSTGTASDVSSFVTHGVFNSDVNFLSGAAKQVTYVYNKLGGNVLDIELEPRNVYDSYEDAVLEYSRRINNHQAKNVLYSFLGTATGSFDFNGELVSGAFSSSLSGTSLSLIYPRFSFRMANRIADSLAEEAGIGGNLTHYSASFTLQSNKQEYDLNQAVIDFMNAQGSSELLTEYSASTSKKLTIRKVYYRSPRAIWRFYGYYGGLNVVGNLYSYGQYADDSTFEIVPVWQNKLQAMAYEDSLYTRASHYSYEIHNNKLKIYPPPTDITQYSLRSKMWFTFTFDKDNHTDNLTGSLGIKGVNNINTLPFANIPYSKINSMGKDWIARWSLASCKETLAGLRGKVQSWPLANTTITLNYDQLISQAEKEKDRLIEELNKYLDELTYDKLVEIEANMAENAERAQSKVPLGIFVG